MRHASLRDFDLGRRGEHLCDLLMILSRDAAELRVRLEDVALSPGCAEVHDAEPRAVEGLGALHAPVRGAAQHQRGPLELEDVGNGRGRAAAALRQHLDVQLRRFAAAVHAEPGLEGLTHHCDAGVQAVVVELDALSVAAQSLAGGSLPHSHDACVEGHVSHASLFRLGEGSQVRHGVVGDHCWAPVVGARLLAGRVGLVQDRRGAQFVEVREVGHDGRGHRAARLRGAPRARGLDLLQLEALKAALRLFCLLWSGELDGRHEVPLPAVAQGRAGHHREVQRGVHLRGARQHLAVQHLGDGRHGARPLPRGAERRLAEGLRAVCLPQHIPHVGREVSFVLLGGQQVFEVGPGHAAAQDLLQLLHVPGELRRQLAPAPRIQHAGKDDVEAASQDGDHAHVRDADLAQHVRESLVVLIRTDEDKGSAVCDLGPKGQREEALALGLGFDQPRDGGHVDDTVQQEVQDQAVREPWPHLAAGQVLGSGAVKVPGPRDHVHGGPAKHGEGHRDEHPLEEADVRGGRSPAENHVDIGHDERSRHFMQRTPKAAVTRQNEEDGHVDTPFKVLHGVHGSALLSERIRGGHDVGDGPVAA
mmetsp:Transcript_97633/g.232367  ORF Transcript_97633/g.232367 Transcript_97633/m.232367 type:complete len:590 (-) Transcript_97633:386-2155(-)